MMSKLKIVLLLVWLWTGMACSRLTEEQQAVLNRGKEVYIAHCLSCHGANGKGLGGTYPSLTQETITADYTARVRYLIANGSSVEGGMLPIPITQKEMIEVINYIQNSWGNEAEFLTDQTSTQLSTN